MAHFVCLLSETTFTWLFFSVFYYFNHDSSAEAIFLATKPMHNGVSEKNARSHSRRTVPSMTCYTSTLLQEEKYLTIFVYFIYFYFIYLFFYQPTWIKKNVLARPAKSGLIFM